MYNRITVFWHTGSGRCWIMKYFGLSFRYSDLLWVWKVQGSNPNGG